MRLYHRQRLLLNFLAAAGGTLGRTDFQKLLFLYLRHERDDTYQFVPHKYGCFSFMTYADLDTLIHKGLLEASEDWTLSTEGERETNAEHIRGIRGFLQKNGNERGTELVAKVYRDAPYFASRSEILEEIIPDSSERQTFQDIASKDAGLLSIGYEGDDIDGYLNRLVRHQVDTLVDVRRNPLSRKHGFSKRRLDTYCADIGVTYVHLPELGIPSHRRRNLETRADYDALFAEYREEDLPKAEASLERIEQFIDAGKRPALTCFEADAEWCHRFSVVGELTRRHPDTPVEHI